MPTAPTTSVERHQRHLQRHRLRVLADELPATSTCNGSGGCTVTNKGSGAVCPDDGNPCTTDRCDGSGTCAHADGLVCNAGGRCSTDGYISGTLYRKDGSHDGAIIRGQCPIFKRRDSGTVDFGTSAPNTLATARRRTARAPGRRDPRAIRRHRPPWPFFLLRFFPLRSPFFFPYVLGSSMGGSSPSLP
jgi:hypothetical protein